MAILEGGFPAWEKAGLTIESDSLRDKDVHAAKSAAQTPESPQYPALLKPGVVCSVTDIQQTISSGSAQVADARASGRFRGLQPEPRADIPSCHMPGMPRHVGRISTVFH